MKYALTILAFSCALFLRAQITTNHWETAVYEADTWRYGVPSAEPDTNWRKVSFNASSWSQGAGGIGFGDNDDNTVIATTRSVYMRITFNVSDTSKISEAVLNVDYDDGFVAYINNVEMARANVTSAGPPVYTTLADANHEATMYTGGNPEYFPIPKAALVNRLLPGTNVLCVQVHNVTALSSDLSSRIWLSFGITDNSVLFGPTPNWFVAPVTLQSSNMPIVVINTNSQPILQTGKITADMGIIYNGVGIRNYMTDPFNNYNGKIGIEMRGNYSASLPQKPYEFETRDVNGFGINVSLLGMPAENDWALIAMYNDKSFMRNTLSYWMFDQMGHWAPRSQLVEVVLNGNYKGVYALTETIKRDANRVDIAKLNVNETTWPGVSGGYILKTDYWDVSDSWQLSYSPIDHPGFDIHLVYVYPKPDTLVPQQKTYIQTFIYDYETALYGPNFTDTTNGWRKYLSDRSFIDYFIVNEMARNVDGFKKSAYFYKEKDDAATGAIGKLKAGPVWDFDWAWKDIWDCSIFQATDGSGWSHHINDCGPDVYGTGWYIRLLQDSMFADELNCRWQEMRATLLDTTSLFLWMDSIAAYSSEAQARHYQLWGHMGQATGTPEVNPPAQTYQEEVDNLKDWIRRRILWLDANMFGNPNNCNLTGVASNAAVPTEVNAYPNPFSATISLDIMLAQPEAVEIELVNALGQTVVPVQREEHNGNGAQVFTFTPPADLPAGIYLLRVKAGDKMWTRQLAKAE